MQSRSKILIHSWSFGDFLISFASRKKDGSINTSEAFICLQFELKCVWVCVCVHVCRRTYVCKWACLGMCVCVCMCVCMSEHVCVGKRV